ncbi:hypothetical protein BpHYR1_023933 [Brachionus plicatilis]|uniref:Uncharacterized protein n=1 Tax=Brachionus plicatilis TaxID=10195 RepID=A0A3M7S5K8_BRAPC|nr:hypothetical protein BpHYR1_023933 [Brachionus plicatilis]
MSAFLLKLMLNVDKSNNWNQKDIFSFQKMKKKTISLFKAKIMNYFFIDERDMIDLLIIKSNQKLISYLFFHGQTVFY